MKLIKIECPSCQQHLEIEAPDRGLPKLPTIIISIASIIIAFSLGSIHSAAPHNPQAAKNNIAAAPIAAATELSNNAAPQPIPTQPAASSNTTAEIQPTNRVAPAAIGAYGWLLGGKLPSNCQFDSYSANVLHDNVYETGERSDLQPFYSANVRCLEDRTIYEIELFAPPLTVPGAVIAALTQKYGNPAVDVSLNGSTHEWHCGNALLHVRESDGSPGFSLYYTSQSLEKRHYQEVDNKNAAAGGRIAPHL